MSAFMVSDNHINFMVNFSRVAFREKMLCYYRTAFEDPAKLGAILYEANVRSLDYRYPQNATGDSDKYTAEHYQWKPTPAEPVTVENLAKLFKAIDCYEYQACEFPTWKESEAYRVCQMLRSLATDALPGYAAAPWGIN